MFWGALIQLQDFYLFTNISIPTTYFYLTLNHTEKNIEIAMSDKSSGSLPAFCPGAASPGCLKGNCKDLYKRQLLFGNVAIQYLGFFFSYKPLVTF